MIEADMKRFKGEKAVSHFAVKMLYFEFEAILNKIEQNLSL